MAVPYAFEVRSLHKHGLKRPLAGPADTAKALASNLWWKIRKSPIYEVKNFPTEVDLATEILSQVTI